MKHYIYLFIAAILIGTIGIFVKIGGDSVHPLTLGFYRLFFAFIASLLICPVLDKNTFKLKRRDLPMYILIGILFAINLTLTNIAYLYAPVQNVSLILSLNPVFVMVFAYFLLKEKITTTKTITLLIAIIGLVIINPISLEDGNGSIIAFITSITAGLMFTLLRKEDKNHSIGSVVWFFLFATIFTLPFPFIFGFGQITSSILALGFISTGIAYLFYNLALEKLEVETASILFIIVEPVIAISLAVLFLSEFIDLRILIGGVVLISSGIVLKIHKRKTRKHPIKNKLMRWIK